ncbi:hypothetical protein, partial [Hymenobacter aerophilus]|uniref:hypothetical protein n=1 Tax=Hymenobacter aerophilus TaxID=119644 RepID=UPI001969CF50
APLAACFELVADGAHHLSQVDACAAATSTGRQQGQYPAGNYIFAQDFHEGGKGDGSHLKFPAFVGVFSVLRLTDYFLNSFNDVPLIITLRLLKTYSAANW